MDLARSVAYSLTQTSARNQGLVVAFAAAVVGRRPGRRTVAKVLRALAILVSRNVWAWARGRVQVGPREGRARGGRFRRARSRSPASRAGRRRRAGLGGALARPRLRAAGRELHADVLERGDRRARRARDARVSARVLADEPPRADRDRARPGGPELPAAAARALAPPSNVRTAWRRQ